MERHLPPKEDRVLMLRSVLAAAEYVLAESKEEADAVFSDDGRSLSRDNGQGTDAGDDGKLRVSTTTTCRPSQPTNEKFRIAEERHRRRVSAVLRESVPRQVALYLHLPTEECNVSEESKEFPTDPFGCIVLLLANHIVHSGMTGYDSRTRSVIKMASVHLLAQEAERKSGGELSVSKLDSEDIYGIQGSTDNNGEMDDRVKKSKATLSAFMDESMTKLYGDVESSDRTDADLNESETQLDGEAQTRKKLHFDATRKFEEIENSIATKLLQLLLTSSDRKDVDKAAENKAPSSQRNNIMRGIKIGGAAVAAGTLLAVTGGMAAPGIAAGIAALGFGTTAALTTLTSTAMMATLFGVGGGGLTAYKMKRRTDGLSEFRVRREGVAVDTNGGKESGDAMVQTRPALYTTVCVTGWLRDKCDFQRPWGTTPTDPALESKLELLKRFYSVYNPENVAKSETILSGWEGREEDLWKELEREYGRDPDHLLPIEYDALENIALTQEEDERLGELLGVVVVNNEGGANKKTQKSKIASESTKKKQVTEITTFLKQNSTRRLADVSTEDEETSLKDQHTLSIRMKRFDDDTQPTSAWDYLSLYGGDLYTVTWNSKDLLQICDYINALAKKFMKDASKEVLKQTALAALMSAVSWPSMVMKVADTIDEPWSLITLRSDEAGIELANCLLQSEEHKPVTLVGFSFGARIVYSCLKELARHQVLWEEQKDSESGPQGGAEYSREPASIVEDAILMGTPKFVFKTEWHEIRRVVAGRLINCYSRKDWILLLMFQIKNVTGILRPTVGTSPVTDVKGIENFDVSDIIASHENYCIMVQRILRVVGHGEPKMMIDK